jgi:rod shape-determining protein MreB
LATAADKEVMRHVLDSVLAPSRVLFLETVRAAAIASGAAAGSLLLVEGGAELTEAACSSGPGWMRRAVAAVVRKRHRV